MLGEFCSRRNNCLILTGQISLGILIGVFGITIIIVLGWSSCEYIMKPWGVKFCPDGKWNGASIPLDAILYFFIGLQNLVFILIGLTIPVAIIMAIYFIVHCTIKACQNARRRAQGFEDLDNL